MVDIKTCRSLIMGEGVSRAVLSRGDECISGYIEYGGRIFSVAIYEYRDIGVIVAKMAPELFSDICSEILLDPRGLITYAHAYENLCRSIAKKIKRYAEIRGGRDKY